ncbi:hypothetical protein FQZ97_508130 [compost metagenome]
MRLMGQPGQAQHGAGEVLGGGAQGRREVLPQGHVVRLAQEIEQRGQQRREHANGQHREGPGQRLVHQQPARQEHGQECRRLQAAPQVVGDLPARQAGQAVALVAPLGVRRPGQGPGQQLPVAANPAVAALRIAAVARRELLVELHVAEQSGTGEAALDQVVAEDAVIREVAVEGVLEGIHRIDSLADERALLEQVLVNVRYGTGIGVDAGVAAEQLGIGGTRGARQADADPWLQDGVAAGDALPRWIEAGAVERVGQGADELPRRVARQLGIGVEGDDVVDLGEDVEPADDQGEAFQAGAAQYGVEFGDLAALALEAHPGPFGGVPAPRAMEQEEPVHGRVGVLAVQRFDALPRKALQRGVLLLDLGAGIQEVAQQGEMQVVVAVGQEADLETFAELVDVLGAADQGGYHHQGACLAGDALAVIQAWELVGRHRQGDQPIHQADRQPAGREGGYRCQQGHRQGRQAAGLGPMEEWPGQAQGEYRHGAQVEEQGGALQQPLPALPERQAYGQALFEFRTPVVDQVVADVAGDTPGRCAARQFEGGAGHGRFRVFAVLCQVLHHMAVMVARGELHGVVDAGRVLVQGLFDMAHGLDEVAPVGCRQQAQAGDAVADGHLVGGLLLGIGRYQTLDAQPRFGQVLLDPAQGQCQRRALALQPPRQLGDEGTGHRRGGARHVRHRQYDALGVLLGDLGQPVRPVIGQVAVIPVGHDARGHAAQVLDQRQAQHDGNGPEFAELQWRHRLVGGDETAEAVAVHSSIAVGDGFQGDVVDPWQSLGAAGGQVRQLAAVPLGKVLACRADLLFDQVVVVQQPLSGGGDAPAGQRRGREDPATAGQRRLVVGQTLQQAVRRPQGAQPVQAGQERTVLLHLLRAEEVRAQVGLVLEMPEGRSPAHEDGVEAGWPERCQGAKDVHPGGLK